MSLNKYDFKTEKIKSNQIEKNQSNQVCQCLQQFTVLRGLLCLKNAFQFKSCEFLYLFVILVLLSQLFFLYFYFAGAQRLILRFELIYSYILLTFQLYLGYYQIKLFNFSYPSRFSFLFYETFLRLINKAYFSLLKRSSLSFYCFSSNLTFSSRDLAIQHSSLNILIYSANFQHFQSLSLSLSKFLYFYLASHSYLLIRSMTFMNAFKYAFSVAFLVDASAQFKSAMLCSICEYKSLIFFSLMTEVLANANMSTQLNLIFCLLIIYSNELQMISSILLQRSADLLNEIIILLAIVQSDSDWRLLSIFHWMIYNLQLITLAQMHKKLSYLVLGVLYLQQVHCLINTICSLYCPSNACNGTVNYNVCQSCDGVFVIDNSSFPNCKVALDGFSLEDISTQTLTVNYASKPLSTPCGSLTNLNGWIPPTQGLEVRYPGVTRTYGGIKIIFGIIIKGNWANTEQMQFKFINTGGTLVRAITTHDVPMLGTCSADNTDKYSRVIIDYPYTTQNTELVWTVNITGYAGATGVGWAFNQIMLLVKACYKRCLTCDVSLSSKCFSCVTSGPLESFLISSSNTCVSAPDCPTSTYAASSTHVCQSCNSTNCVKCSTINVCTQCAPSFYLYSVNTSCVSTCPTGSFADTSVTPNVCTLCANQCSQCTSATVCSACTTSGTYQSFLLGTSCVSSASCPGGKYAETVTHVCQPCQSPCSTCQGTKTNCTACVPTYYYLSNVCYSDCPVGYYENTGNGLCTKCDDKCSACGTSATDCSACTTTAPNQAYLNGNACVLSSACPAGTYPQPSTHICTGCNVSCSTCQGTKDNCTACAASLYYLNNVCYSNCPTGYYESAPATGQCLQCNQYCTACDVSATNCSACVNSGTYQSYLNSATNSCVISTSCPTGTYAQPATHVCTGCNSACTSCTNSATNCSACALGYFYLPYTCYSNCPAGYYESAPALKQCLTCDQRCTSCDISATNCSACTTSGTYQSFLNSATNTCVVSSSCPSGTYPQPATHICTSCTSPCSTCQNVGTNCTGCILTYYYLSNVCYSNCPTGYYESAPATGQCIVCDPKCTACDIAATNCSACTTSGTYQSYLNSATNTCVASTSCPSGTYPEAATHICTACTSPCSTCQNVGTNCTACVLTYYYLSNVCYSNCPTGYYESAPALKQCLTCDPKCTACDISATNCSACTTSGTYESYHNTATNTCVASTACPAGTYPQLTTHICTGCNVSCLTCQGTKDNCTDCVLGLFYLSNVCYSDCPVGYYESAPATKKCLACNAYCIACDISATNCSSCTTSGINEAFLNTATNSCVLSASCPAGTYPQPSTHICTGCNVSCTTCQGTKDNCTSCILGLYLLNNICYSNCPNPYYESSPAVGNCLLCNSKCTACDITSTNCSACTTSGPNQAFLNTATNSCVVLLSCPAGKYGQPTTHICEPCNTSCSTCVGTKDNCTWCVNPLYLLNNICYVVCPISYYGNAGICILCHNMCPTCYGTQVSKCLSCQTTGPYQSFYQAANTTCYTDCPAGFWQKVATHTCEKCDISCTQCTNDPSPCQACNSSYSYFNQTCLAACPAGYYSGPFTPIRAYNACLPCDIACKTCFGAGDTKCYTCNFDIIVKKSGSYCKPTCMPGWGDTDLGEICVYCNTRCVSCWNNQNNCTACKTSGGNEGFMILTDLVYNTGRCYNPCPAGYYENKTSHFCDQCLAPCSTCSKLATNCTACKPGFYFLNFKCYNPCPDGYFINGTKCSKCQPECLLCAVASDNCSLCDPAIPAYFHSYACLSNCPNGFFQQENGTNSSNFTCEPCNYKCLTCDNDPSPCFTCAPTYFYFQQTCDVDCYEPGYFPDKVTWSCLHCDLACVKLDLKIGFQTLLDQAIIVTLDFSEDLDWNTFPMKDFQTFTFGDPFFTIDMFNFEYTVVTPSSYQIKITPKLYIFMYNLDVQVTTMDTLIPNITAINERPFHLSVYNQTQNIIWSYIKAPGISDKQKQVLIQLIQFTNEVQSFTNTTGVKEILQSGVFAWIFPGVQITSAVILVNGIIPQHMYEGIRVMASFIFYQVPSWEKSASNMREVFNKPVSDMIPDTLKDMNKLKGKQLSVSSTSARATTSSMPITSSIRRGLQKQMQLNLPEDWRFKRTGFSTFFLIDIYMQIILIGGSWILLLVFQKIIYRKDTTHKNVGRAFVIFHKIHEISLMYVTIALVLQWIYFNKQSQQGYRWASFFFCLFMLVYFLLYELYVYYDMFQYPQAHVNTRSYLFYATKYGHFLSKIRYEQYDIHEQWSPKVWFRPYNYHILSFYKKFMMMFALPIFHQQPYTQISCLILLQILQMLRFYFTWPFFSACRNLFRILLETMLLCIFIIVLVTQYLANELMLNNQQKIPTIAKWYNVLGWIGFALVLFFNLSIIIIAVIDFIRLCTIGNTMDQMDSIRREYYWEKVKKYEDENQDINVNVVSKWVKLGNLRELETVHEQSKYVTIKVQKLKIIKQTKFFTVHITNVTELRMEKQGFIYQQNSRRLKIKDKIRRIMEVSEETDKEIYHLFCSLYEKYNAQAQFKKAKSQQVKTLFEAPRYKDNYEMVVETFLKVNMNEYPNGGRVYFYKNMIKHVISLYFNDLKIKKEISQQRIEGLPLSKKLIDDSPEAKRKLKQKIKNQNDYKELQD